MNSLFGLSTTTLMFIMVGLMIVCLLVVGGIALANRTMFRLGIRNIPRRRAQSMLVVLGLMLSTLIIAAAFTTGDSLDYSITRDVYTILGPSDEELAIKGGAADQESARTYVSQDVIGNLERRFADDKNIEAFIPAIREQVPAFNPATRQSEPQMSLVGVDPARTDAVGGISSTDGKRIDIAALPSGSVLLNPKAADILSAKTGDSVQILVNNRAESFTVAGIVKPTLLTGWTGSGPGSRNTGGITMPLAAAQALLGKQGQINFISISNVGGTRGGVTRTDAVTDTVQRVMDDDAQRASLGLGDVSVKVEKSKQEGVKTAETFGNIFTTFFLVLGLFSMAAGILLIFMIFVMLASERKAEMGMARAVGLKRRNLIQTFVAEGMAYTLAAGLVGAALGVVAAWLLVVIAANFLFGESFSMELRVSPRSLVIAYALGVVLTFITVAVSSWRVSKLNIVAAIREISDEKSKRAGRGSLIWGVVGLLFSAGMMALGQSSGALFPFALGITVALLSVALILRFAGLAPRPVFTAVGALIFLYWSLPENWSDALFGQLDGDIEMFFLSGMGMVVGSTLILVYNARLLTNLVQGGGGRGVWIVPGVMLALAVALVAVGVALDGRAGDVSQLLYMAAGLCGLLLLLALFGLRAQRFGPALKMAIAYPLANRFRTGMTIAMFSLIVFSITVMSTLTANFAELFVSDAARAGWDITAIVNANNPVPDFKAALAENGFTQNDRLLAVGRTTFPQQQQVRKAETEEWKDYPVVAADGAFLQGTTASFTARAKGYDSDEAVWTALRTSPGLAVVDGLVLQSGLGVDPSAFNLSGTITRADLAFEPVTIEVQDPVTKKLSPLTVIGVLESRVSQSVIFGVYTNTDTYTSVFGPAKQNRVFIKLAPGTDAKAINKAIKAALVTRGVQSFDLKGELEEQQALQVGFNQIFQAFMALGLLVGVAALGVIAFRSVVERRQQIGMLRAIGYQKGTVALSFIMESAFISVMGVLAGVIGASILSRNLLDSRAFAEAGDLRFFIPWLTVIAFLVAGFAFALLMTWLPARRAAAVPIADALRYE